MFQKRGGILLIFLVVIACICLTMYTLYDRLKTTSREETKSTSGQIVSSTNTPPDSNDLASSTESIKAEGASVHWPMERALERITKKPFGLHVRPTDSPVSPERFSGYHTAVDFEVFSDEATAAVSVNAICSGPIRVKRTATGYGGVLVQECHIAAQAVTVIYGHLKLTSIQKQVGNELQRGETFAVLGAGESAETGGERKHLHLGIHKGTVIDIRGYVASAAQLNEWIDLRTLIHD